MSTAYLHSTLHDQAEAQVREQLEQDLSAVREPGTKRILEHLRNADSVLELDARRLRGSSGRSPSEDAGAFRRELGREPREYLAELKMEAARELLRHRPLKIWRIAEAVGYPSLASFSRAFKKVHGISASILAKQLEPAMLTKHVEAAPTLACVDDHFWYAAATGALTPEDLGPLTARLRELADVGTPEIVCFQSRGTDAEVEVAKEILQSLRPLSWEQRRARLRFTLRTDSPALFELLGQHYERTIFRDSRAAQWLADLALTHIEANADRIGGVARSLEALAWAWRGYALYRRAVPAVNYSAANYSVANDSDGQRPPLDWSEVRPGEVREAFERAWSRWREALPREAGQGDEAHVEARICLLEGEFLQSVAEADKALPLMNRAIVLARVRGPTEVLMRAQIRRLTLLSEILPLAEVVAEAGLVLAELRRLKQGVFSILVYALLAKIYEAAGHTRDARRYVDLVNQNFDSLERKLAHRKRQLQ